MTIDDLFTIKDPTPEEITAHRQEEARLAALKIELLDGSTYVRKPYDIDNTAMWAEIVTINQGNEKLQIRKKDGCIQTRWIDENGHNTPWYFNNGTREKLPWE